VDGAVAEVVSSNIGKENTMTQLSVRDRFSHAMLSEGSGIPYCQRMRFPTRRESMMLPIASTITHFLALRVLIETLLDRLEAADSELGLVL
jgi:hypothetical protein